LGRWIPYIKVLTVLIRVLCLNKSYVNKCSITCVASFLSISYYVMSVLMFKQIIKLLGFLWNSNFRNVAEMMLKASQFQFQCINHLIQINCLSPLERISPLTNPKGDLFCLAKNGFRCYRLSIKVYLSLNRKMHFSTFI